MRCDIGLLGGPATAVSGKGIGIQALTSALHNPSCVADFLTAVLAEGLHASLVE